MVKAYLKYEYSDSVGLFKQSKTNIIYDNNLLIIAANEYLVIYNPKTRQIIQKHSKPNSNSVITCLFKNGSEILAGYEDGEIVIFDLEQKEKEDKIVAQMNEHTASINVIQVSDD